MTRDVIAAPPSMSVAKAWSILQKEKVRHLPIVDAGRLVGILSDRDLLRVGDPLQTGRLSDTSVSDAARMRTDHKIDSLPIVVAGRLVGLVTSTDLLLLLLDELPALPIPFDFRIREMAVAA